MDDRIRLVAKVNGGHEIRIRQSDLADIGQTGLATELQARGINPGDLGEPVYMRHRRGWVIPVRKRESDE